MWILYQHALFVIIYGVYRYNIYCTYYGAFILYYIHIVCIFILYIYLCTYLFCIYLVCIYLVCVYMLYMFAFDQDDHRYYRSRTATAEEQAMFWIDEKTMYAASRHDTLSESYRSAAVSLHLAFLLLYGSLVSQPLELGLSQTQSLLYT